MLTDPIQVTLLVTEALEKVGVPYLIGGSLASSVHGFARATRDADIVADLSYDHIQPFVNLLGHAFYADPDMIQDAIRAGSSFNVIHLDSMFKIDVFILKPTPFLKEEFKRRQREVVISQSGQTAYVATPEDIILNKLEWYKMGGEVADRQWSDVLGIIKVQAERLDMNYLRRWAEELGLSELLVRSLKDAGHKN